MDDEAKPFNLHLDKISESTGAYFLPTGPQVFFRGMCTVYIHTCTRGFKHVLTFLIGLHLFGDEKTNL